MLAARTVNDMRTYMGLPPLPFDDPEGNKPFGVIKEKTHDDVYLDVMRKILREGDITPDRTGTGTVSLFGTRMEFDLKKGFPLLTTRKIFFMGVVDELLWFISGSTNAYDLPKRTQKWWTPWASEKGNLGPTYGYLLRNLGGKMPTLKDDTIKSDDYRPDVGVDQLKEVINELKNSPESRRHVISLWNREYMPYQGLPTCHGSVIQFHVSPEENGKRTLSCQVYQRSADFCIGVPANIASYALLTHIIAQITGYEVGKLIWVGGDTHIYLNHLDGAQEQLSRSPLPSPTIRINEELKDIDELQESDITLLDYNFLEPIKFEVSV